jgi:hypothetical protein
MKGTLLIDKKIKIYKAIVNCDAAPLFFHRLYIQKSRRNVDKVLHPEHCTTNTSCYNAQRIIRCFEENKHIF